MSLPCIKSVTLRLDDLTKRLCELEKNHGWSSLVDWVKSLEKRVQTLEPKAGEVKFETNDEYVSKYFTEKKPESKAPTVKLKPCPFCPDTEDEGLGVFSLDAMNDFVVWCLACGAKGPIYNTEEKARYAWNKRRQNSKRERVCMFLTKGDCQLDDEEYEAIDCGVECRGQHALGIE